MERAAISSEPKHVLSDAEGDERSGRPYRLSHSPTADRRPNVDETASYTENTVLTKVTDRASGQLLSQPHGKIAATPLT